MADPTAKLKPKFITRIPLEFWERVYVASIASGATGVSAAGCADRALERRYERMVDNLIEQEIING